MVETFSVIMEGLICHVGDKAQTHKTHSAVAVAHGHKPRIFVYRTDTIAGGKDFNEALKKGDTVKFENLDEKGNAKVQSSFKALVPGLEQLLEDETTADNDLDEPVKQRKHDHKAVVAYVIYPEGKLGATLPPFNKKLKFTLKNGRSWEQCVAKQTLFWAEAAKEIIVAIYDKKGNLRKSVTVRPGARVFVTNSPDTPGNHFHHYLDLTKAERMAKTSEGSNCQGEVIVTNNPECTNSGWP